MLKHPMFSRSPVPHQLYFFFFLIAFDYIQIDGTTDITRTVHFGTPTDIEKDAFTRVLKGFISVATAIFPPGAPVNAFL